MAQTQWEGRSSIRGYTHAHRMAMLTFSLIGLQFTWGIEMTYFTPYLLELGLAKSQTSLVWLAPPLSGLIVQPLIGAVSDSSTMRWGRRRPYMLGASVIVAFCMLMLGWSPEIGRLFTRRENVASNLTIAIAVFCIYAIDFAINVVQATARSLIVDSLPLSQQQLGSAWAGRMLGVGHLLGYFVGTLDLMKYFGTTLGTDQFKQVCAIASFTLFLCVGVTSCCVSERILLSEEGEGIRKETMKILRTITSTALHLPRKIQAICWITFWSWIGWSPFFVYGTTWVGETYYRESNAHAQELKSSTDIVGDIARKGSIALFLFSVISFAGSVVLPWLVRTPGSSDSKDTDDEGQESTDMKADEWAFSRNSMAKRLRTIQPDITTAWALSQLMFACSMIMAPFSTSFHFASILVALCGIPWAMYGWGPLALLGEEINRLEVHPLPLEDGRRSRPLSSHASSVLTRRQEEIEIEEATELVSHLPRSSSDSDGAGERAAAADESGGENEESVPLTLNASSSPHPLQQAPALSPAPDLSLHTLDRDRDVESVRPAGVYLGVWNIFATIPQFLATFIAMAVFSLLEPGRSREFDRGKPPADSVPGGGGDGGTTVPPGEIVKPGLSGTATCLAVGAVCAFVAAALTFRLKRL